MITKFLKTDRIAWLSKVGHHRQRKASIGFTFSISRRACRDNAMIPARITYSGQDTGWFTTGMTAKWETINTKEFLIVDDQVKTALIRDLKARAERLYADCRLTGRPIDVFAIRDALFAEDRLIAAIPNVKELVDRWLIYDQQREDAGEIVKRTKDKNKRWTNDFWGFVHHKYGPNARLINLKPNDIREFVVYLKTKPRPKSDRPLSNNTAQSTALHANVLMNYAYDNEYITRNPFVNFKRKMDTVDVKTLTEEEILNFCTFPLESPALQMVRDIFFFLSLTGLSYCDLKRLTANDIQVENGVQYIYIKRRKMIGRKGTIPATIPLSTPALEILAKYTPVSSDEPLMALPANWPLNRCIKQIAAMCGLNKSISTKIARSSLATYLLNNGVPLTSVSAILGHSSTATTQKYYAKVQAKQVISDMNDLSNRLNGTGLYGLTKIAKSESI